MMNRRFATGLALSFATWLAPAAAWSAEVVGLGGKCLDVRGGEATDGAALVLWTCHGRPNQHWQVVDGVIKGLGDKCLDVKEGQSADGQEVLLWPCHGRPNQRWAIR